MSTMPTWDKFMAPLLAVVSDRQIRRRHELYDLVAEHVGLTEDQKSEVMESGNVRYENRVGWATSELTRVGALARRARGQYQITDLGQALLAEHPDRIRDRDLRALAGYPRAPREPAVGPHADTSPGGDDEPADLDPEEQVVLGIERIHASVAAELLERLHAQEPVFFERAVLRLLVAMGYGGADAAVTHTQLTNDEGIDGIIDQDALGLSRIYVQAKRYALDSSVGRPESQAFVGALQGKQASQGVFLTTARFSAGAREYADKVATRVVRIDGARLSSRMIRYGVGVQEKRVVRVVEVDEDFFE